MKRIILMTVSFLMLASLVFGASVPIKFAWDYNTDNVTIGYKLYRTDGTRVLLATIPGKEPILPFLASVDLPDGLSGTATFVLTAYSATQESGDSNTVSYPFDLTPAPVVPAGFRRVP
jgi:hypothetical protein